MGALIEFNKISKIYKIGGSDVIAANKISYKIHRGEYIAIVGQSGSGKSTCMNIMGCLDVPTSGNYILNGIDVAELNDDELAVIRNRTVGFIFQQYNLLAKLNVIENVELSMFYAGVLNTEMRERALKSLERVGLSNKIMNYPNQLSGGEQQRVSIARALAGNPSVILADEPTGALDSKTGRDVIALLEDLNNEGNTVVLITHDNFIAQQSNRIIRLQDGKVIYDGPSNESSKIQTEEVLYEI